MFWTRSMRRVKGRPEPLSLIMVLSLSIAASAFRPLFSRRLSTATLAMKNPSVFFDVAINGKDAGRIVFELVTL